MTQHDDLNLMGMQELDSTLSIFDSSHPREPSTTASSNYQFENSVEFSETLSHTIVVDLPADHYSKLDRFGRSSNDSMYNETRLVTSNSHVSSSTSWGMNLKTQFRRDFEGK